MKVELTIIIIIHEKKIMNTSYAQCLPILREVKLEASVVGHPTNDEMVPPRLLSAVCSPSKEPPLGLVFDFFYIIV